jgi:hypothetical protein
LTPKQKKTRPSRGSTRKPQSRSIQQKGKPGNPARARMIVTDVTPDEKRAILKHCIESRQSVSQYLAQLALADMKQKDTKDDAEEEEITLRFTRPEMQKLRILARISQSSIREMISDLISPRLKHKRLHGPLEPDLLRLYVTPNEHTELMKHMVAKGVSARNYIAQLALEDIAHRNAPTRPKKK